MAYYGAMEKKYSLETWKNSLEIWESIFSHDGVFVPFYLFIDHFFLRILEYDMEFMSFLNEWRISLYD